MDRHCLLGKAWKKREAEECFHQPIANLLEMDDFDDDIPSGGKSGLDEDLSLPKATVV